MRLLLASKSQARHAMLAAAGVPFVVVDAGIDEEAVKADLSGLGAAPLAQELARAKALSVAAGIDELVLGCDQTLETVNGAVLGKPESRADAQAQLQSLSGQTHQLHSAAVIASGGKAVWQSCESATLAMRPLSQDFIEAYLDSEYQAIRGNAGCYRIEGAGVQLFDQTQGSHFAILGLPLIPLLGYLRTCGILLR